MSSSPNLIESFRRQSFVVLPKFLDRRSQTELRQAADTALSWSRAQSTETSHSTPRISLLTQASSFEHGATVIAPILIFASSPRLCALLQAVTKADAADIPRLKDAHYYHEQTKRDWDGDWHRDSQFGRTDPEVERELIASSWSVHLRVAFEPCLFHAWSIHRATYRRAPIRRTLDLLFASVLPLFGESN